MPTQIRFRCPDCKRTIRAPWCRHCKRHFGIGRTSYMDFLPSSDSAIPRSEFNQMPEMYEKLKVMRGARKALADWTLTKIEDTNLKLASLIGRLEKQNVLEIGAGRGYFCWSFNQQYPDNRYFVIEYEEANLDYGFKLGFFHDASFVALGSVYSLPFADRQFDLVVISEVLEHLPDLESAMSEIHRVIKPEGWLVASVPNSTMYLHPEPILISLLQSVHHWNERNDNKGFRLLLRRLRRLADDNTEKRYHRPFLPRQFRAIFETHRYRIVKHVSSIMYLYHPPFSCLIDSYPSSLIARLLAKGTIRLSDYLLQLDVPLFRYVGTRQHILARKTV